MNNNYFIALGGNIGDTKAIIQKVIERFNSELGSVLKVSRVYKSKPLPTTHGMMQDQYLNAVLLLRTALTPEVLLKSLQKIEEDFGRDRIHCIHWGPRTIDLDIISVGDISLTSVDLTIPHPRMNERDFVLIPIKDIEPNYIHPTSKKRIELLISELPKGNHFIESAVT